MTPPATLRIRSTEEQPAGALILCMLCLPLMLRSAWAQDRPWIGIDANYVLGMEKGKKTWHEEQGPVDPFALLAKQGANSFRIRLWVGDDGQNRLKYATETALRAQKAGLRPYLVIFLSDDWADLMKQPVPARWKDLPLKEKGDAIEAYCESVVRYMQQAGVTLETFAIGNEIDFGLCGEYETQWANRLNVAYMKKTIWARTPPLIKAGERGVLKAQPKARFIVHLATWNNPDYCSAFWQTMRAADVRMDILGLSYYPSSSKKPQEHPLAFLQATVTRLHKEFDRPVLLCEVAYPAQAKFGGQFADWNQAAEGYPLDEPGQARWLADLVTLVRKDPAFLGMTWWSPEWYWSPEWARGEETWRAFALFDENGRARLAVQSLGGKAATTRPGRWPDPKPGH